METNKPADSQNDQPHQQAPEVPPLQNHREPQIGEGNRQDLKAAAVEKDPNRMSRAEKWMVMLTALMFFSSLLQWNVSRSQLDEMKSGGEQTDRQIQRLAEEVTATTHLVEVSKETLDAERRNFLQEQRPYVIPDFKPYLLAPGQHIQANVYMSNYGKSPATNVRITGAVFHGPDAMAQADRWFQVEAPKLHPNGTGNIMFPGMTAEPNKGHFTTIATREALTAAEYNWTVHTDFSIVLVSRVIYTDASGRDYWTDSCASYLVTSAMPNCYAHNQIY